MLATLINKLSDHLKHVLIQGAKFALVGFVSVTIDYTVYIGLTRFTGYFAEHLVHANMIAFIFGFINNYFLNKYWTFDDGHNGHRLSQIIKYFIIIFFGSFVLAQSTFYFLIEHVAIYDLIAKLIGIFIGFSWNFFVSRKHVWN